MKEVLWSRSHCKPNTQRFKSSNNLVHFIEVSFILLKVFHNKNDYNQRFLTIQAGIECVVLRIKETLCPCILHSLLMINATSSVFCIYQAFTLLLTHVRATRMRVLTPWSLLCVQMHPQRGKEQQYLPVTGNCFQNKFKLHATTGQDFTS